MWCAGIVTIITKDALTEVGALIRRGVDLSSRSVISMTKPQSRASFGCKPASDFPQCEKISSRLSALPSAELSAIKVKLGKVSLNLFAIGYERSELVAVEIALLEEGSGILVDEIHSSGVNGDMSCAKRSDSCSGSIDSDVAFERDVVYGLRHCVL